MTGMKDSIRTMLIRAKLNRPPIIIGGCGRSGTTLMSAILSAHPRIYVIPFETVRMCPGAYDSEDVDTTIDLDPAELYRLLPLKKLLFGREHRFCEKTPKNVLFFGRIVEAFEGHVRLIHVVRDGRDVITSRHPTDPDRYWVSRERWKGDVSAGLDLQDDPRLLMVRYEDLVLSFPETLEQIMEFLEEDLCEEVLSFSEHASVRKGPWLGDRKLKDLYSTSIGRWKKDEYGELAGEFMRDPQAVSLLKRLGYDERTIDSPSS